MPLGAAAPLGEGERLASEITWLSRTPDRPWPAMAVPADAILTSVVWALANAAQMKKSIVTRAIIKTPPNGTSEYPLSQYFAIRDSHYLNGNRTPKHLSRSPVTLRESFEEAVWKRSFRIC